MSKSAVYSAIRHPLVSSPGIPQSYLQLYSRRISPCSLIPRNAVYEKSIDVAVLMASILLGAWLLIGCGSFETPDGFARFLDLSSDQFTLWKHSESFLETMWIILFGVNSQPRGISPPHRWGISTFFNRSAVQCQEGMTTAKGVLVQHATREVSNRGFHDP